MVGCGKLVDGKIGGYKLPSCKDCFEKNYKTDEVWKEFNKNRKLLIHF